MEEIAGDIGASLHASSTISGEVDISVKEAFPMKITLCNFHAKEEGMSLRRKLNLRKELVSVKF